MEGIKCPVCMAITIEQGVKDGELVKCNYCRAKFTVTRLRRFNVLPKEMGKFYQDNTDYRQLEEFVRELDNEPLFQLVKLVTGEIAERYKKKDYCMGVVEERGIR